VCWHFLELAMWITWTLLLLRNREMDAFMKNILIRAQGGGVS
jgi:hypothetical protein